MSDTGEQAPVKPDDEDESRAADGDPAAHFDDIDDGCGCAEVWEHLSEQRDE